MTTQLLDDRLKALAAEIQDTYSPGEISQLIRLIEPAPSTALMSNEAFEQVMNVLAGQNTRRAFSDKSIAAARLVFVKGASVAEAAADTDLARQVVHRLITRIRRRMEELPADWVKVTEWYPGTVAEQLRALATSLRSAQATGELEAQSFTITLQR
ncbi:TrfB-related DNA-binding protein [Pseudomonas sp. DC3000-4b1]|uniref:TrfB-related DNA-binding protein n=1 Tax=unclassified Pseudomonas TaxID=196821 RepID=UPI003CE8C6D8